MFRLESDDEGDDAQMQIPYVISLWLHEILTVYFYKSWSSSLLLVSHLNQSYGRNSAYFDDA